MLSRTIRIVAVFLSLAVGGYLFLLPLCHQSGDRPASRPYAARFPPSALQGVDQDFSPTPAELACLRGKPAPAEGERGQRTDAPSSASEPFPNTVHFVFLQKLPLPSDGQGDFGFSCYLSVRSALVTLTPKKVVLHYAYTSANDSLLQSLEGDPLVDRNEWIKRLRPHVDIVRHTGPINHDLVQMAHQADLLRLEIMLSEGGIYLDTDVMALRPFADLLASPSQRDVIMGNEGGDRTGLCNAVIVARRNSSFIRRWTAGYAGADLNHEWNHHSVRLPKQLAAEHPDEVCELPPDAFFWPTWSDPHVEWMHEPIDSDEAAFWKERIKRTGGALFENQLTYHAWNHGAKEKYLDKLTPALVRSVDTRFNLLVRRFLERHVA